MSKVRRRLAGMAALLVSAAMLGVFLTGCNAGGQITTADTKAKDEAIDKFVKSRPDFKPRAPRP